MRRVCCFCESWESGGIESLMNNILQKMDLTDIQVDIVAACINKSVFTSGLQEKGVRFIELSGEMRTFQNIQMFRELLRKRDYDVVHFNLFQGLSLYYIQVAKEEGVAIRIAHGHNTALRKSRGRVFKLILHRAGSVLFTNAATDLWACSRAAADFVFDSKVLKQKGYQFIPNGIDIERFRFRPEVREMVRAELGLADSFVIGNVGRLCYQKNQDFLLEVFSEVLKQTPNSFLFLVGEGEMKSDLQKKARRLGIHKRVIFYGLSDHVERLLWAMDVFAFPSRFEGFGIAAVEAQTTGLPVICSDQVPEEAFVTPVVKRVNLDDAEAWSEALLTAKTMPMRETGAKFVADAGFAMDDVVARVKEKWLE